MHERINEGVESGKLSYNSTNVLSLQWTMNFLLWMTCVVTETSLNSYVKSTKNYMAEWLFNRTLIKITYDYFWKRKMFKKNVAFINFFINHKHNFDHDHENDLISVPHHFCDNWNDTKNSPEHNQKLTCVQQHKCVEMFLCGKTIIHMEPNIVTYIVNLGFHWTSKPPGASILLHWIMVQFTSTFLVK